MTAQPFLKLMILLVLLAVGGIAAFVRQDNDQIQTYKVQRIQPSGRMLGAILPREKEAWFFKLSGPKDAIASQVAAFHKLVESIDFSKKPNGEPSWQLPTGWKEQPGVDIRFATLEVPTDAGPLECTVTRLPMSGDLTAYLLANINRWRDQMRVAKLSASELPKETTQIKLADSQTTATVVDFTGDLAPSGGMGMGSLAGGAHPPMTGGGLPQANAGADSANEKEKLTYKAPENWTPGALTVSRGGITVRRAAVFEVLDGEQRVEITVTKLSIGSVLANVNRWRGQIGMDDLTAEQFEKAKKQIDFAGEPADYVQFVGAEQAILGVIASRGQDIWFVKLQGSADLAARERPHFEEFVESIRF